MSLEPLYRARSFSNQPGVRLGSVLMEAAKEGAALVRARSGMFVEDGCFSGKMFKVLLNRYYARQFLRIQDATIKCQNIICAPYWPGDRLGVGPR